MSPNVYSAPEKFGLETIGEVQWTAGSGYDHDLTVIWRDREAGRLYIGSDSGCSCDVAFEGKGLNDLTRVDWSQQVIDILLNTSRPNATEESFGRAAELVLKFKKAFAEWLQNHPDPAPADVVLPTAEEAAHVLCYMDRPGGYPPGAWTDSLISVMDRADYVNTHKFARAFPGYAAALSLFKNDPDGVAKLQVIATNPQKDVK